MAQPSEKLAEPLDALHKLQQEGKAVLRSADLSRTHRERLIKQGFLKEIIKGWYIPSRPDEPPGDSTVWYTSYWVFCASYLYHLKGDEWCLSPEQSLSLHVENRTIPKQLLVRAEKARNNITAMPHNTSLLVIRANIPENGDIEEKEGLRLYSLSASLVACSPGYFRQNPTDVRTALSMIRDASEVLEKLLAGGHSTVAGRLAGAFRNIGNTRIADDIIQTMKIAGYDVREIDPFEDAAPVIFSAREPSPLVSRIRLMWQKMRPPIMDQFPLAPGLPKEAESYLLKVEENYVADAYNSLSIEGYQVSPELIERVQKGNWNPDRDESDKNHRNALAARGYWQAFQSVKKSIQRILSGENAGQIVNRDHGGWYREMFAPGVSAGLLKPQDLAGYRNMPVYIRRSMHVPPSCAAVRGAMPAFFDLLEQEESPAVRVVLGHFIFVYIHPYMDGNGRIGRFLMNAMMAGGGYPWTVVPLSMRDHYMNALESASVEGNIIPFTDFLAGLLEDSDKDSN